MTMLFVSLASSRANVKRISGSVLNQLHCPPGDVMYVVEALALETGILRTGAYIRNVRDGEYAVA